MRLPLFAAAAVLSLSTIAAHADVMYTYVGGGIVFGTTFTITSPQALPYNTEFPVTTSSELFDPGLGGDLGKITNVEFDAAFNAITAITNKGRYTVFTGSYNLAKNGTYLDNILTTGALAGSSLTVSGIPAVTPPSPTTEPSSIALLGTGMLGLVGVARRRFARS